MSNNVWRAGLIFGQIGEKSEQDESDKSAFSRP